MPELVHAPDPHQHKPKLTFESAIVGEELATYEYVLTGEDIERYRRSVRDPEARFPTIAIKNDATALEMKYDAGPGINARQAVEFFNPPTPGKRIRVTGKLIDKYVRRGKPYIVNQATAMDEDGRLIERTTTWRMCKTEEVGKKWGE